MHVLFVGITNSGRSLIAAELLRAALDRPHVVRSAGTAPSASVSPQVAAALAEVDIDVADYVPLLLNDDELALADLIVLTCDNPCLFVPGKHYLSWQLPTTIGQPLERVRAIRDDLQRRVVDLARQVDTHAATARHRDACP